MFSEMCVQSNFNFAASTAVLAEEKVCSEPWAAQSSACAGEGQKQWSVLPRDCTCSLISFQKEH